MLFKKWLPWKLILKRAAMAYGFLDPITFLARLRRFGQPSEVQEPLELLRAGVIFHARGLINTRAIQYNLDWVWPYWIVKQFKPKDISFIPRGFAFSHVNLTHRNWTAVGLPDIASYPIVDPRGLLTPYFDSWSIDFWVLSATGDLLVPAEARHARQHLEMRNDALAVQTRSQKPGLRLDTRVWADRSSGGYQTHLRAKGVAEKGGYLVLALRPYNPEGIQFIDTIGVDDEDNTFLINDKTRLRLGQSPQKVLFSSYEKGDVARILDHPRETNAVNCDIGMATAAALYPIDHDTPTEITVSLPLMDVTAPHSANKISTHGGAHKGWRSHLSQTARLQVPDEKIQFLYDAAVRTMLLLSADEPYPGPYTYKRFWFRDACLMIHALLGLGLSDRAERMLKVFPQRQTMWGYFQSQHGEWDSNGQVLWLAGRISELTGIAYDRELMRSILKGADWIINKRLDQTTDKPHQGLLPAGFSAEHLGPNDYYYWDNFWGVAGLRSAARLAGKFHSEQKRETLQRRADAYHQCVLNSIDNIPERRKKGAIPASPYRRMDAGAVGSLVADYPLRLFEPADPMIMKTVAYLKSNCFHSGAFFQDMIHSGINIYLTLAIAQTLLRAGEPSYRQLIRTTAELASPTGQWPEAIHPFTRGGCMGDGQHGWAAAEWLMMMRNLFVREEGKTIFIGSGIFPEWLQQGQELAFGPTLVPSGRLSVHLGRSATTTQVKVEADHHPNNELIVAIPGFKRKKIEPFDQPVTIEPE
jgi:hypothetical protein